MTDWCLVCSLWQSNNDISLSFSLQTSQREHHRDPDQPGLALPPEHQPAGGVDEEGGADDLDHHRDPPHLLPLHLPCRRHDPGGHERGVQPGPHPHLHHELVDRDPHTPPLRSDQLLLQGTGQEQILAFLKLSVSQCEPRNRYFMNEMTWGGGDLLSRWWYRQKRLNTGWENYN